MFNKFIPKVIIFQLVKSGGNAVLLGDDTWGRLIPGKWLRSHALYSFHTWDLDTVDNGKLPKNRAPKPA